MNDAVVSEEQLIQQLQWRYATKQFDAGKKIPAHLWQTLEDSLVLTPSSFGLQPWKFFVITDVPSREKLLQHSWGQRQVVDGSHLVVMAIKKDLGAADVDHYIEYIAEVRGVPVESLAGFSNQIKGFMNGPIDLTAWATRQVYIALGQFMLSAALLGVDTCPMEGFIPGQYDEILGLTPLGYSAVVLCPAGYRAATDKYATLPKVRYPKSDIVQHL
ncbi:MAG: putative NAD(P)H nitroreductase YfkO [Chroococcopsis gigantea SAG 12.99]|jgi:nitroreductase|nr:NAD(P)H-dependent oxidoreductase [Chlorogloea purpurea SAG 13.99]MDV2999693.1 putative NAD(P)H nitroreductase YfkO [Chroococcopsis gigantea SAG 12.99]